MLYHQQSCESCGEDGEGFGDAVDADGCAHVGGGEWAVGGADVGFVDGLAEVVVRASETAVKDTGEGRFGVTAVGACVLPPETSDKGE